MKAKELSGEETIYAKEQQKMKEMEQDFIKSEFDTSGVYVCVQIRYLVPARTRFAVLIPKGAVESAERVADHPVGRFDLGDRITDLHGEPNDQDVRVLMVLLRPDSDLKLLDIVRVNLQRVGEYKAGGRRGRDFPVMQSHDLQ